jgi:hypothetical protein
MYQILVFNAIHTIVTDIECNIRIGRLPLGRGTDQWNSGNIINVKYNIYIIVTDMEGNIRIYRLPKGRGTDQWK